MTFFILPFVSRNGREFAQAALGALENAVTD
jgi:hypothetical protein